MGSGRALDTLILAEPLKISDGEPSRSSAAATIMRFSRLTSIRWIRALTKRQRRSTRYGTGRLQRGTLRVSGVSLAGDDGPERRVALFTRCCWEACVTWSCVPPRASLGRPAPLEAEVFRNETAIRSQMGKQHA